MRDLRRLPIFRNSVMMRWVIPMVSLIMFLTSTGLNRLIFLS